MRSSSELPRSLVPSSPPSDSSTKTAIPANSSRAPPQSSRAPPMSAPLALDRGGREHGRVDVDPDDGQLLEELRSQAGRPEATGSAPAVLLGCRVLVHEQVLQGDDLTLHAD